MHTYMCVSPYVLLILLIACLKGGLTQHFIHHNITAKIGGEIRDDG